MQAAAESKKFTGLDALRGMAIAMVIMSHFDFGASDDVRLFFANAGVILFFLLSGFLMYWTLSIDRSVANYVIRRSFRILPIYWLSIIIVVLLHGSFDPAQVLSNATFSAPLFGQDRILGVYWTLYIEVMFYCAAPVIFFLGTRAVRLAPYILTAALFAISATRGLGANAPYYLIFCLCGMQVAAWYSGRVSGIEAVASIAMASAFFTFLVPIPHYIAAAPIVCAAMLYCSLQIRTRLLPLEWLGAISYSWYLLHSVAGYSSLLIPVISFAAAVATYLVVERPAISLGKRLIAKMPALPVEHHQQRRLKCRSERT